MGISINTAIEAIKKPNKQLKEIEWTLIDRLQNQTLFGYPIVKNGTNCSGLVYFLLKKGGLENNYSDESFRVRSLYGAFGLIVCLFGLGVTSYGISRLLYNSILDMKLIYNDLYGELLHGFINNNGVLLRERNFYMVLKGPNSKLSSLLNFNIGESEQLIKDNLNLSRKLKDEFSLMGGLTLGWRGIGYRGIYFYEKKAEIFEKNFEILQHCDQITDDTHHFLVSLQDNLDSSTKNIFREYYSQLKAVNAERLIKLKHNKDLSEPISINDISFCFGIGFGSLTRWMMVILYNVSLAYIKSLYAHRRDIAIDNPDNLFEENNYGILSSVPAFLLLLGIGLIVTGNFFPTKHPKIYTPQ